MVVVFFAGFSSGQTKSGGIPYAAGDGPIRIAYHLNSTTNHNGITVPCRAWHKVSPERQPFCLSFVDEKRPAWYVIHRNGYLYYEPDYAPTNPDTFDEDSSFFVKEDNFFPGFASLESLSLPNHFTHAGSDGFERLSKFEDTLEFKNAASYYGMDYSRKGE